MSFLDSTNFVSGDYYAQTGKALDLSYGSQIVIKAPKMPASALPPKFFRLENQVYTYDASRKCLVMHANFKTTAAAIEYVNGDKS